jgi:hypothetical protein
MNAVIRMMVRKLLNGGDLAPTVHPLDFASIGARLPGWLLYGGGQLHPQPY